MNVKSNRCRVGNKEGGKMVDMLALIEDLIDAKRQAEADCMVMAGRLIFEDHQTMSPEVIETVKRWKGRVLKQNVDT